MSSLSTPAFAQMPGAPTVDVDLEAAKFRAFVLEQVRPVMEAWMDAWRGQGHASLESFYTNDAVLAVPPATLIGGRDQIKAYAGATKDVVNDLSISLLDFEPADRMAGVYGTWIARSSSGSASATGRHVTVLSKNGKKWVIRTQLFAADSPGASVLSAPAGVQPLTPLSVRLGGDASGTRNTTSTARSQQRAVSSKQRSGYYQLASAFASLRTAWNAHDAEGLDKLLRDNSMIQFPGETSASPIAADDVPAILARYGKLSTVELDFDLNGTLAFLSGRYYVERRAGDALSGNYIAVLKNAGSGWAIRLLVFG